MNNPYSLSTADALDDGTVTEPLGEGGTWLLDLVAAVDHLGRGARPQLTVWDAIGEAAAWARSGIDHDMESTSFDDAVQALLNQSVESGAAAFQAAIRRWVLAMAIRYNDSYHWPHPTPRRAFPPGTVTDPELGAADD